MGADDDIARALPKPPLPAPARRAAAIEQALRRFDGLEETAQGPAARPGAARPMPWRSPSIRLYAGALLGSALVALVALPLAWKSVPQPAAVDHGSRPAAQVREAPRPSPPL
ncbi:MAG TPA: hypothetical protein VGD66_09085, partial [Allosphingosinicella sp.]